jgi:hypothetical protein
MGNGKLKEVKCLGQFIFSGDDIVVHLPMACCPHVAMETGQRCVHCN